MSELETQYSALSEQLKFYADQRFKIAGAYLVANGFLANVAADYRSIALATIGVVLSYLCLSWEKKTTLWWGKLITALRAIEQRLVPENKMVKGYETYPEMPTSFLFVKPSYAAVGIYLLFGTAWVAYGVYSWSCLWAPI